MHKKVLLHVDCLRGTGELAIAANIAKSLAEKGVSVIVASGNRRHFFPEDNPLITFCDLPSVKYDTKTNNYDVPSERKEMLEKLIKNEKPDAVLISYWPFGNGKNVLDNEMQAVVQSAEASNIPIFGSVREVLHVDSQPYQNDPEKTAQFINQHFKKLFVHGDEKCIPLTDDFNYLHHVTPGIIHHTGYVVPARNAPHSSSVTKDKIIITAGGGDFRPQNLPMLQAAIRSLTHLDSDFLRNKEIIVIYGKSCDDFTLHTLTDAIHTVQQEIGANIKMKPTITQEHYQPLLDSCALFIGQGGVGTISDIMVRNVPAIVMPVTEIVPGQYAFTEQLVRAQKLQEKGILDYVIAEDIIQNVGSERLIAEKVKALLATEQHRTETVRNIDLNGAQNTASAIANFLERGKEGGQPEYSDQPTFLSGILNTPADHAATRPKGYVL